MARMTPKPVRSTRGFDDEIDERTFVGRGGVGPAFEDSTDCNGVQFSSNAHDERGYEDMRRLPSQRQIVYNKSGDGEYLGHSVVIKQPAMSERVKDQVFCSIGDRVGTMTSKSLLNHDIGEGDYGADGGLSDRTRSIPSVTRIKGEK